MVGGNKGNRAKGIDDMDSWEKNPKVRVHLLPIW